MTTVEITMKIRVKHWRLLKAINAPLVLLGFQPWVPSFCIETKLVPHAA